MTFDHQPQRLDPTAQAPEAIQKLAASFGVEVVVVTPPYCD